MKVTFFSGVAMAAIAAEASATSVSQIENAIDEQVELGQLSIADEQANNLPQAETNETTEADSNSLAALQSESESWSSEDGFSEIEGESESASELESDSYGSE